MNSTEDRPSIAVTTTRRLNGVWRIAFAEPCPFCNARHYHGGQDGPEPNVDGQWLAHCQSEHKPFRDDCVPVRVKGMPTRCRIQHGVAYYFHLADEPAEAQP